MLVGALGASAISQLYQSSKAQGTNSDGDNDKTTTKPATTATAKAAAAAAGSTPPISDAATKLITDLRSLLLNLQASNGPAKAGTSSTPLQQSLQSVSDDLQKAGGSGHHRHHHGGAAATGPASALDAGTSTGGSATTAGPSSQLAQAVSAYASSNLATPSAASALLTA